MFCRNFWTCKQCRAWSYVLWHQIWVFTVCQCPFYGTLGLNGKCATDVLGPVVQSVVSLMSSLRVISLTVLADSIYNILIFFAEKMWVAFALQNVVSFEQLGPGVINMPYQYLLGGRVVQPSVETFKGLARPSLAFSREVIASFEASSRVWAFFSSIPFFFFFLSVSGRQNKLANWEHTFWHVCPAKIPFILGIHVVWSVFLGCI